MINRVMTTPRPHALRRLPNAPAEIIARLLTRDRRVLIYGAPGTGKSTLAAGLASALMQEGRDCWCLSADPGSPAFGIAGTVCLGRWQDNHWHAMKEAALCSLDGGRFRLPLIAALRWLITEAPSAGVLLVDGPGVVRGIAGAELLAALVEATAVEAVLMLAREHRPLPLAQELLSLPVEVFRLDAAATAQRPSKRARARRRTERWDQHLANASVQTLDLDTLPVIGSPPPRHAGEAWVGRQIALLDGARTLAMGEAIAVEGNRLQVKLPLPMATATGLLVRDAARSNDGLLGTVEPFIKETLAYLPADLAAGARLGPANSRPIGGRIGIVDVALVNGVFGDPLLHLRLRHQRRSLLFDLGEGARLPARVAHQVSDVFITHAHLDHIAGFLWLLRSRIGDFPPCRIYGPPGLAANIDSLSRGILWDRVEAWRPRFEVIELHGSLRRRFRIEAGDRCSGLGEEAASDGLLLDEPAFRVRAITLDHVSPVLAFALEPSAQINIRKDQLVKRALTAGPWLTELKRRIQMQAHDILIQLPDGRQASCDTLAKELALVSPGKRLVYATDFADSEANRRRVIMLAQGAHTFFCEATFIEADRARAGRTAHLTARACGEIAQTAGVGQLVPFHFSRRYQDCPEQVYAEIAAACTCAIIPKSGSLNTAEATPSDDS